MFLFSHSDHPGGAVPLVCSSLATGPAIPGTTAVKLRSGVGGKLSGARRLIGLLVTYLANYWTTGTPAPAVSLVLKSFRLPRQLQGLKVF